MIHKRMRTQTLLKILTSIANGARNKREIQDAVKMSWATCSGYVNMLNEHGVIRATPEDKVARQPGPKAFTFSINRDQHLIFGMEVDPRSIVSALVDIGGNEVFSRERRIANPPNSETMIDIILEEYNDVLATTHRREEDVACIALSLTGAIDREKLRWIKSPKFEDVSEIDIGLIARKLPDHISIRIEHDVIARATSVVQSRNLGPTSYVFIHLSDGVGLSYYDGKSFLTGSRGLAGEIGHIPYPGHGLLRPSFCFCKKYGCLETIISSDGITRAINDLKGISFDSYEEALANVTDDEKQRIYEDLLHILIDIFVYVSNIFDPDLLVVGGATLDPWLDSLKRDVPGTLRDRSWMNSPREIIWYTDKESNPADGISRFVAPYVREVLVKKMVSVP